MKNKATSTLLFLCFSSLLLVHGIICTFTISSATQNHVELLLTNSSNVSGSSFPVVINTWPFYQAAQKAWKVLEDGGSALDAVEKGCAKCEELQCDGTVGYGGSPDENGETTLDALIMDGETHDIGAVGSLRRVKSAISVARQVMERTDHTLLVGSQATDFALMMGFKEENLTTVKSESIYFRWIANNCQPNFWENVSPNPMEYCGPYTRANSTNEKNIPSDKVTIGESNHDTIGMIAIDSEGRIAGGTSTNGARHKIAGRVGDSPIPGSGAYVDKNVGGAAATGDGDVMMRFMPSLLAVEYMRLGMDPDDAANLALERIVSTYPTFSGAVIALSINGTHGAACYNLEKDVFRFSVGNAKQDGVKILSVPCITSRKSSGKLQ